jgi:predicted negative regulator of RcsB-dependent stress response
LRRISTFLPKPRISAVLVLALFAVGCSLEKKSALNRGLQNLTAHYNILFNAKEILKQKQEGYAAGFVDNYSELLAVYQDTAATTAQPDKDLDAAKSKANTIISIKEQSHYIPDAYLVLGKANFLQANYFDAVEYFNYVGLSAKPKQTQIKQEALVWKGRALLYLHKDAEAKKIIDSAIQNINPKKSLSADVYAAKLQYDINVQEYPDAETMALEAIKYCKDNLQRMRWTFILGQLQELNQKPADAVASYARVAKSNVTFDMAFNADLNRIRIEDSQNGVKISRLARLRALLKNQNNADFTDQIYYQIAQLQYADNNIDDAIKSYKQSANYSTRNQSQKGLSYLRLADIYFKNKADYTLAKNYYDSTLTALSPNYPGYVTIQKKADNLQLLTDNLKTIAREDTLQMLAALDEPTRAKRVDEMEKRQAIKKQMAAAANNGQGSLSDPFADTDTPSPVASVPNGGNFYFYNTTAVSQGFSDFKRVWGNRKLEDNWRRSSRSNADLTTNTLNTAKNIDTNALPDSLQRSPGEVQASNFKQDLLQNLPLTPELLTQSNMRRYDAYLAIANFYRDVLNDKKEAAAAYEKVLALFPDNGNKAAIYYNLYRLYSDSNIALSDKYKALVLKEYPETAFAKTILDPDYGKRMNDEDTGFSVLYNQVYDLYAAKKYPAVITSADGLLKTYPNNKYASQLEYLKAFAAGHQEKLDPFKADLQQIAAKYPDDQLITPLIKQHLTYIEVNQVDLAARPVVITDRDMTDGSFTIPIVYQQQTEYRVPYTGGPIVIVPDVRKPEKKPVPPPAVATQPVTPAKQPDVTPAVAKQPVKEPEVVKAEPVKEPVKEPEIVKTEPVKEPVKEPEVAKTEPAKEPVKEPVKEPEVTTVAPPVQEPVQSVTPPVVKKPSIFSMRDSTDYFFVVNVSSGTTNVASSRFGIGQFNRVQYQGPPISHQLKNAGSDNQLIYVGRFTDLEKVKDYARRIVPLLPDIMKVPKGKYSFFIITGENLDKLADAKRLDSYVEYYQENY